MDSPINRTGVFIEMVSNSPQDTFDAGKRIAGFLKSGCVVALDGVLGSGKTFLVKGIARGLGIRDQITSPTFTIINEYLTDSQLSTVLYHIDAYRLENDEDFEQIGGRELLSGNGISVIEWSERIKKSLPQDAVKITIEITGCASRLLHIEGLNEL